MFSGPAGLGKTTLCNIITNSMGGRLVQTNGGVIHKPKDLIGSLIRLRAGDVFFVDEIHRIPMAVEEYLYTAMEDGAIDAIASNGEALRLELQPFTLLGATTREGMLSEPLLHRFGIICRLELYNDNDLYAIIRGNLKKLACKIQHDAGFFLASMARGTPRLAIKYLKRTRDFSKGGYIDLEIAQMAMKMLGVYHQGLTKKDILLLRALVENGHAMGLVTLSMVVHESPDTIENVLEPHLMRVGLMDRTARGRIITNKGRQYLEEL